MSTLQEKRDAIKLVADAATIHRDRMKDSLRNERYDSPSFQAARGGYVSKLSTALGEVARLKLDEELKLAERVTDLTLEESVDLLHAVEDHIRELRRHRVKTRF